MQLQSTEKNLQGHSFPTAISEIHLTSSNNPIITGPSTYPKTCHINISWLQTTKLGFVERLPCCFSINFEKDLSTFLPNIQFPAMDKEFQLEIPGRACLAWCKTSYTTTGKMEEIRLTSWGNGSCFPLFTRFNTSQVVQDVFQPLGVVTPVEEYPSN